MKVQSGLPRLPWRAILFWLIAATVAAWSIGFIAGLIVRHFSGA
jgi:hypothetical protein